MIPNTGTHILLRHNLISGEPPCEHDKTTRRAAGVMLEKENGGFAPEGCFTTDYIPLGFDADEMVLTWNCAAPSGTGMLIEYRVQADGMRESVWYQVGAWPPEKRLKMWRDDPDYGPLIVDHFKAERTFNRVRFRANFRSHDGARSPILRAFSLCVSDTSAKGSILPAPATIPATSLDVPYISQYDAEKILNKTMIASGACAPTSVTMVLNYYGIAADVNEIGARAFDPQASIYGNWAYLITAASEFGPDAWVERFNNWDKIEEYVSGETPVIISVKYGPGELDVKPEKESSGHLMVVCGFDAAGNIICNDPDFDGTRGKQLVFDRAQLSTAFFRHGGVGLVIRK
ncbi:MAG TPA: C39 family peptidase [bacterium]|nr:C39 family peptidase [bacterium]